MDKLTVRTYGLEINALEGTYYELIDRLQKLKAWSLILRNPNTDEPDPNGIRYIGVGLGGSSGHGKALFYERPKTVPECEARLSRLKVQIAKQETKLKQLKAACKG